MKKTIHFLVILIFALCLYSKASAVMRAPFLNSKVLQPIPSDISPNISGSVNNNDGQLQDGGGLSQESPATPFVNENEQSSGSPVVQKIHKASFIWPLIAFSSIVTLVLMFLLRRKK